ncbi:MAG: nicotinate-nicotinamide nucleotide adenylyltransferase [Fibrobacteraceae bacterium]|nr:nicotinate-nicotinamide nucleotide adenylyltransferase [Fibrobacteraceae bacterium]
MSGKIVAVMGGAFDPVHQDHVSVARICLEKKICDEVWFVPSPDRWDKTINASPEDRFAMLRLATSDEPRFILSDEEIQQGDFRGSYVFLSHLRETHPDICFRLLVGADSYEGIPHWRDPLYFYGTEYNGHLLLKEFELIVFERAGYPMPDLKTHLDKGYANMFLLGKEQGFEGRYSSTDVRRSLLKSRSKPEGLLREVFEYIISRDLYRF